MEKLILSPLEHTWLLDLDGTVLRHNGFKIDGQDSLLPGAREMLAQIPPQDMVIFLTSRPEAQAVATEAFLASMGIRYDRIIYGLPYGERILINDAKPSGLKTAIALNPRRDECIRLQCAIDSEL